MKWIRYTELNQRIFSYHYILYLHVYNIQHIILIYNIYANSIYVIWHVSLTKTYVVCRFTRIRMANNRTRTIRTPTAIKLLIVLVLM